MQKLAAAKLDHENERNNLVMTFLAQFYTVCSDKYNYHFST